MCSPWHSTLTPRPRPRSVTPVADPATHTALLRRSRVLSLARLLDAAALFGPSNQDLLARLLAAAFAAAPWLREEAAQAGAAAAANLAQVAERSRAAAADAAPPSAAALAQLADAARYFTDAGATLAAFCRGAPGAAVAMLSGEGAQLLPALALIHDQLLPLMRRVAADSAAGVGGEALQSEASRAARACRLAAWQLLHAAYLRPSGGAAERREALLLTLLSMSAGEDAANGPSLLRTLGGAHDVRAALASAQLGAEPAQQAQLLAFFQPSPGARAASQGQPPADPALDSRVAAVRDLLPDFGPGFVAACLQALGHDVERATAALLEDALPECVKGLDRAMDMRAFTALQTGLGKGKGPLRAAPPGDKAVPKPRAVAAPSTPAPPPMQAYRKHAERQRWQRHEAHELLDGADAATRAAAKAAGEYVDLSDGGDGGGGGADEYDDDFDDDLDESWVAAAAADGAADADSEDEPPLPVPAPAPAPAVPQPSTGPPRKFWLAEGRVYTYAKPGAQMVMAPSAEAAHRLGAVQAATAAAQIHGLGQGGNRGGGPAQATGGAEAERDGGGGRGSGGRGGGGRAAGRSSYAHKEAHKAAVGNHHRKDRAAQKQRALLGPG